MARKLREPRPPQLSAVKAVLAKSCVPLTAKQICLALFDSNAPWEMWDIWWSLDVMEWQRQPRVRPVRMRDGSVGYCTPSLYAFLDMAGKLGPMPRAPESLTVQRICGDVEW